MFVRRFDGCDEWQLAHTLAAARAQTYGSEALVFIRFIGAFVFSIGCLYLFALVPAIAANTWGWMSGVFAVTAWVRAVICVFTTTAIIFGGLSLAWWSVPVSDGLLAVIQVWVIWKGWVQRGD